MLINFWRGFYNIKLFLNVDPEGFFERVSSSSRPFVYCVLFVWVQRFRGTIMLYPDKRKKVWARR